MTKPSLHASFISAGSLRGAALTVALISAFTMTCWQAAQAQTFTVLHTFTGEHDGHDGAHPMDGVVLDRAGNVYGVTFSGGLNGGVGDICFTINDNGGCGTAFKLGKRGSSWLYSILYRFQGPPDGANPAGVVVGPDGRLYGATYGGGIVSNGSCLNFVTGCGTAFQITPPPTFCSNALCPWNENVLYAFTGLNGDGGGPNTGALVFDNGGNIYGTTNWGGANNWGSAYKLAPSHGSWTESVIYSFDPTTDGLGNPNSGFIVDQAGNFYGTTGYDFSGSVNGAVYQLIPSQSGWTANVLHSFQCTGGLDGCFPTPVIFDPAGNLLSANSGSGFYGEGTVFKLQASDDWSLELLHTFTHGHGYPGPLTMDAAGNLYGTGSDCDSGGGHGCVFKLTPSGGGYLYTELHDFNGNSDGDYPNGPIAIDANGNLYGTSYQGGNLSRCLGEGANGCGTVWEITP